MTDIHGDEKFFGAAHAETDEILTLLKFSLEKYYFLFQKLKFCESGLNLRRPPSELECRELRLAL